MLGYWIIGPVVGFVIALALEMDNHAHDDVSLAIPICRWLFAGLCPLLEISCERDRRRKEAEQAKLAAQRKAQEEAYRLDEPRRQEEERRRQAERREAEQRALLLSLTNLVSDSKRVACELGNLVLAAEDSNDLAEREFESGVFAPFWDAVEQAAVQLARCDTHIRALIARSTHYDEEARKLTSPPPAFELSLSTLLPPVVRANQRLRAIVRRAQGDPHFATIFELRKINKTLVAGFSTLGEALKELPLRVESSIERLASTVGLGIADIISAQQRTGSDVVSAVEHASQQQVKDSKRSREQAERLSAKQHEDSRKVQKLLDDTWRGRKPIP